MKIAVIGAGPCGLVATKTLAQAGLDVVCYEMSDTVGGHWKIDNLSGKSAAYESLTTNTNKQMSRLSDYEMPAEWPDLPTHAHLHRWWCDYVRRFALDDLLRLECEVHTLERIKGVEAVAKGGWRVGYSHKAANASDEFDAVILASGNYWLPKQPDILEAFTGEIIHAREYRSPERPLHTRGRRVLVVGTGNTGCELALEIKAAGAEEVYLSARSGNWIFPKYIDTPEGPQHIAQKAPVSHPLDPVPWIFAALPESIRDRVFNAIGKLVIKKQFGEYNRRLERAGLPPPPDNPLAKRPTVADGLAEKLEAGELRAVGSMEQVDGRRITFKDGLVNEFDVVICATGYGLSYPYLDQRYLDTSGDDMLLYRGLMHPEHHSLFVVGVSRPTGGFWPIAEAQSQFIAKLLAGTYRLPEQEEIEKHTSPVMNRDAFNPALYGLSLRSELQRGARRISDNQ